MGPGTGFGDELQATVASQGNRLHPTRRSSWGQALCQAPSRDPHGVLPDGEMRPYGLNWAGTEREQYGFAGERASTRKGPEEGKHFGARTFRGIYFFFFGFAFPAAFLDAFFFAIHLTSFHAVCVGDATSLATYSRVCGLQPQSIEPQSIVILNRCQPKM